MLGSVVATGALALGCSGGTAPGSAVGNGGGGAGGSAGSGTGGLVLSMGGMGGSSGGGGAGAGGSGGSVSDPNPPTITKRDGCVPKPGPDIKDIPGARLVHAAKGIDNIDALGLFGGALYYAETNEGISRLSPPETQTSATLVSKFVGHVWSMVVTGNQIFTVETDQRELWRSSLAALPAMPELVAKESYVDEQSIVADDTTLYFSTTRGGIYSLPLTSPPNTAPTLLVPTVHGSHMQLANGMLYYMEDHGVSRVALAGGTPEPVTGGTGVRSMAIDGAVVYVAQYETISKSGSGVLATGTPISEGSSFNKEPYGLQLASDRIYYREGSGSVAWVKKDGSDCRIVLAPRTSGFASQSLALTDTHLYVIVNSSDLYEIPR